MTATAPLRHLYAVKYRRIDNPGRVFRLTVVARDADEAREYVRIKDPSFRSTVSSPKRRGVAPDHPHCPECGNDVLHAAGCSRGG